jgi:hypothetical protein
VIKAGLIIRPLLLRLLVGPMLQKPQTVRQNAKKQPSSQPDKGFVDRCDSTQVISKAASSSSSKKYNNRKYGNAYPKNECHDDGE